MPSALNGAIAKAVYAGFRGRLLTGTLRLSAQSGSRDSLGDAATTILTDYPCEGFIETYSLYYRTQAGIPEGDVRLILLARSVPVVPTIGTRISFRSQWYQVRRVSTDPALATYDLQSFLVS